MSKKHRRLPPSAHAPVPKGALLDLEPAVAPAPVQVPTTFDESVQVTEPVKIELKAATPALNDYPNATKNWYGDVKGV